MDRSIPSCSLAQTKREDIKKNCDRLSVNFPGKISVSIQTAK